MRIIILEKTDSTNDYAKRLLGSAQRQLPFAVVAKYQTKGKGRQGGNWDSEYGKNVLLTVACYYHYDNVTLNKLVALAAVNVLKNIFPSIDFRIKWPNDILAKKKKIAGILIERVKSTYIVGIGINTNQTEFKELPNATSIKNITGFDVDNEEVVRSFVRMIEYWSSKLPKPAIHMMYEDLLIGIGQYVRVDINGRIYKVRIKEVNFYGQLVVVTSNGKQMNLWPGKAKILYG